MKKVDGHVAFQMFWNAFLLVNIKAVIPFLVNHYVVDKIRSYNDFTAKTTA